MNGRNTGKPSGTSTSEVRNAVAASQDEVTLHDLLREMMLEYKAMRRSPRTLEYYEQTGKPLGEFFNATDRTRLVLDVRRVTQRDLQQFLIWLAEERKMQPASVQAYGRAARAMFNWAWRQYGPDELGGPARGLRVGRDKTKIQAVVQPEMMTVLLNACKKAKYPARERALVLVLFDTGIRLGECVGLRLPDVHADGPYLDIRHAKGGDERRVPMRIKATHALQQYFRVRSPANGAVRQVFLNRSGLP